MEIKTIAWVVVALIVGGGYAALIGDDSSEMELISINVDGVAPSPSNMKDGNSINKVPTISGEMSTVNGQDGNYSIQRDMILVTNGKPTGLAADFINWILGAEGQAIVAEEGFVDLEPVTYIEPETAPNGVLKVAGSTTIQSMMVKFVEAYEAKYNNVKIQVTGGGSGAGATLVNNTVDIGMMSRDPTSGEKVTSVVIAKDGVVMIVDKASGVTNLSIEDIAKIFNGDITNWNQVGGHNLKIAPIIREGGSGTRETFDAKMAESLGITVDSLELSMKGCPSESSNGAMLKRCSSNPGSIGYVNLSSISDL